MTYRRALLPITVLLVFFAVSAQANATTRYAIAGGNSSSSTCTSPSDGCSLYHVLDDVILTADEVIVMPGTHDVGTGLYVRAGSNSVSIHGADGQPRPTIKADTVGVVLGLCMSSCPADLSTIRHLRIENVGTGTALSFYGGSAGNPVSIDDVEAVAGSGISSYAIFGWSRAGVPSEATIRNTTAYAPNAGANGGAIGSNLNLTMRNVTAAAPGSVALRQGAMCDVGFCIGNTSSQVFNSILAGQPGGPDVRTTGCDSCGFGNISLDYSNFDSILNCTGCSISAVGSAHNQTAAPLLVGSGNLRQQAGSPTIDAGVDAVANGSKDPDGTARKLGAAPDIGAYEDGHPRPTTDAAANVTETGATLRGSVNPLGFATTYYFDWGTTTAYGNRIPATALDAGSATVPQAVSQDVAGLSPGTTVHYRLVAANSFGPVSGADQTFTTLVPPTQSGSGGALPGSAPATQSGTAAPSEFTFAGVRLTTNAVTLKRGRYVLLPIRCPVGQCVGSVTLTAAKRGLGTASFSIRGGATQSVKLNLSRAARTLLKAKRSVKANARLTATASGQKKTRTQTVTIRVPRRP